VYEQKWDVLCPRHKKTPLGAHPPGLKQWGGYGGRALGQACGKPKEGGGKGSKGRNFCKA